MRREHCFYVFLAQEGTFQCMCTIVRERGVTALLAGLTPRANRLFISQGIQFTIVERLTCS